MLEQDKIVDFIKGALREDIGKCDLTTALLIPSSAVVKADIVAKSAGIIAGLPLVEAVYRVLDSGARTRFTVNEGGSVQPGKAVCYIEGRAASVLKGERVALNLLSRASGVATAVKKYVHKAAPYGVEIYDTRKTTPNMRYIEKYAVRMAGGRNHRMGLYDQVLIKDNHLAILRELRLTSKDKQFSVIGDSIKIAKKKAQKNIQVEIEVANIAEFEEALAAGADIIMLDNMPPDMIRDAVNIRGASGAEGKRVILEASGNINLNNIEEYAKTGVDRISIGAITHSSEILDFSLEII